MDPTQFLETIYSPSEVIINLILSFFLGLFISYVYKNTHKGMSYSQSFMITNIFVAIIVCMVIMIIGNSIARAFALVGALSIIRFRTVIKDTKDIAYIFWSLAAGMACGTGSYFIAVIGTVIISLIAFILFKTNYGSIFRSEFILQFRLDKKNENNENSYQEVFSEYCSNSVILNTESSAESKSLKLTFDIRLKEDKNLENFTLDLANKSGISEVAVVTSKNDIDY